MTYHSLPVRKVEINDTPTSEKPLADITNLIRAPSKRFYMTVYTSTSEDEDNQPLIKHKKLSISHQVLHMS